MRYRLPADTLYLGTWQVAEDTDKHNYLIIQSAYDIHSRYRLSGYHHYTNEEVSRKFFTDLGKPVDKVFLKEYIDRLNDTVEEKAVRDRDYQGYLKAKDFYCYFSDAVHGNFSISYSLINGKRLINIEKQFFASSSIKLKNGNPISERENIIGNSMLEVRPLVPLCIFYQSKNLDTFYAAFAGIDDSTLANTRDSDMYCKTIIQNMNNTKFYSDTLHFYRVNKYHENKERAFVNVDTSYHLEDGYLIRYR